MLYRVSILALIKDAAGKILLIRDKNGWDFPGGGLELNESPFACLKREILEELQLESEILTESLPIFHSTTFISKTGIEYGQLSIYYQAIIDISKIQYTKENLEFKFYNLQELKKIKLNPKRKGIASKLS
jgi:8-oxo-dGTP diphosphatase